MFNIEYLIKLSEVYSCNCKKNIQCKASNCSTNGGFCSHTIEWQYAKRTPLNYIKRIINIIRGIGNE
mgnify:CR=1 FL=1